MPPNRKSNTEKSQGKRGERTSPRKRKVPQVQSEENSDQMPKTPKRRSKVLLPPVPTAPSTSFDCTPSTSYASTSYASTSSNRRSSRINDKEECAFYKVSEGEDGKPIFSKSLIKYFMTIDSPDMNDLKNKRFNTSFLHEKPRPDRDIQIFTPEEDLDPKWTERMPVLHFDMPEIPGSEHARIFEPMPMGDSDEDLKKFMKETPRARRRSCAIGFKGKPLPDEALSPVDYTGLLDSDSSRDKDDDCCVEEREFVNNEAEEAELDDGALMNENSSILLSLLSAPASISAARRLAYSNFQFSLLADITLNSRKREDERLLKKYKDIMGNKQVNVVLRRLPLNYLEGMEKISEVKKPVETLEVPTLGLSKLQKKKRGGYTKP